MKLLMVSCWPMNFLLKMSWRKILPGLHPFFGLRLKAQLLLFYPKPDMLLEGKVVKLGKQSIHVVVLGFSSATIIDEDIREEFKFKSKHGKEVFASKSDKHHRMKTGTIIRFVVKSFDEEILHMMGSLLPPHTGSVSWLDRSTENAQTESNIKQRRDPETTGTIDHDNVTVGDDTSSLQADGRSKKSKKHSRDS